jgi:thymidylate synthase
MNYKEIVQNVLRNGVPKQPTRMENGVAVKVENGTIGTFCEIFRHDMAQGFPLSTLRKLPFRSICVELEGLLRGLLINSGSKIGNVNSGRNGATHKKWINVCFRDKQNQENKYKKN